MWEKSGNSKFLHENEKKSGPTSKNRKKTGKQDNIGKTGTKQENRPCMNPVFHFIESVGSQRNTKKLHQTNTQNLFRFQLFWDWGIFWMFFYQHVSAIKVIYFY